MDGRGGCLITFFIERLWRSVKYEEVYLKDYKTVREAAEGLRSILIFITTRDYISRLNTERQQCCISGTKKSERRGNKK
ncbi:hypothetical protein B188_29190 [Candidatus Brocadiaceae bacterium B188]|nr:hypothetical protein B188_29190 [Candidatus Brocadiaceae bacterium B188]